MASESIDTPASGATLPPSGVVAIPDPSDPEYTTSFHAPSDADTKTPEDDFHEAFRDAREFFDTHGFVVVRDMLTPEAVERTVDEVWDVAIGGQAPDVERDDPTTWVDDFWPLDDYGRGFVDVSSPYMLTQAWTNLQTPAVVRVFQDLLSNRALYTKRPRYGVMRPTQPPAGRPEWKTAENWLHWDQNPWREPDFARVQGLLTLTDHTLTSGGFECVPGCASKFKAWQASNERRPDLEDMAGGIVKVPTDDPMQADVRRVTMRPGSLLVWDSRTAHCNYPVQSTNFRMVQYCTFAPAPPDAEAQEAHRVRVEEQLRSMHSFQLGEFPAILSSLGRQIVGLDVWG